MKFSKRLLITISLILATLMLFSACTPTDTPEDITTKDEDTTTNTDATSEDTSTADTEDNTELDKELEIKMATLNGTTGFGMAKLISDKKDGKTALNYNIAVETDASNITAALINGSLDIAALPTNAAATLYNKTNGKVQMLAINTLGVLYVVTGENVNVTSMQDLSGKTVYCPAQNPEFVLKSLIAKYDVKDVTVDTSYAQPADLRGAVATGKVDIAVLPEPMVTMAMSANANIKVAVDMTKAWNDITENKSKLTQGCVVVRREFAEAHPNEVAKFLEEYEASIKFTNENPKEASELIVSAGIFAAAPVAEKAIPKCNITFVSGAEMKNYLEGFYAALYEVAPNSVGGKLPDDGIYYTQGK